MKRSALALLLPLALLCGCESPAESPRRSARAPGEPARSRAPAEPAPAEPPTPAQTPAQAPAMNETASPPRPRVQTATFGLG